MARIETYVFLDLETTGIPKVELNKTKITELSMVAVSRSHVLETRPGALPRVVNKLSMCFNPMRVIDPGCTEVTGLCNILLENQTAFNLNVFNIINNFLECLQKPVCLIAQNGQLFDFPILKNHFEKLNCCLPDDIQCADSLHAFYDLLKIYESVNNNRKLRPKSSGVEISSRKRDLEAENGTSHGESTSELNCKQRVTEHTQNLLDEEIADITKEFFGNDLHFQHSMQEQNEQTPRKSKTPSREIKKKVSRKIFYGNDKKPDKSYKLHYIYERVLRRPPPEAHRAENDCVMTIEISVSLGKRFVDWVDDNHIPFADVKAMRIGVPLGQ